MTDSGVVSEDIGHQPRTLITSSQIAADLGDDPSTPLQLTIAPNLSGTEIAIVATSALIHDRDNLSGIVVTDRTGRLLGFVNATDGVGGQVSWSPDGKSLVYVTSRAGHAAIARWAGGYAVTVTNVHEQSPAPAQLDDPCFWSTSNAGYLCDITDPSDTSRSIWVSADAHDQHLRAATSSSTPLAWIG